MMTQEMGDQSSRDYKLIESAEVLMRSSSVHVALAADSAGREELVARQKLALKQLQSGEVPSGVTGEFCKPYWTESGGPVAAERPEQVEVARVDRSKTEQLLQQIQQAENAAPPPAKSVFSAFGWPPGKHPADQRLQNLSAAERRSVQDIIRDKHVHDIKSELAHNGLGVGERLERTLDRPPGGALDKLPAEKRAEALALAATAYRAMLPGGGRHEDALLTAL